jgi:protein TonB
MEPAFSRITPAWPLAGLAAMPPEPDDPAIAIPPGVIPSLPRELRVENTAADIHDAPAVENAERADVPKARESKRKWPAAVVASCLFHAAAALAFLIVSGSMVDPTDLTQIEGVDQAGDMVIGNAAQDQVSAGDVTNVTLIPMVSAKPVETIKAEPVDAAETVQPVVQAAPEAPVAEALDPVQEPATVPEPAPPAKSVPSILAVQPVRPDDNGNAIVEPESAETAKASQALQPAQEPEAEPVEAESRIAAEEIPLPQVAPKPVKKARKITERAHEAPTKKPIRQVRQKPAPGSGGANASDSRRGVATGRDSGNAALASRGGGLSGIGNAAVSNYPGKIAAKLRRAARNISGAARRRARNNAQVAFVVSRNGGVASVRLVKSSGSSDLDKTAMAIIRRAAPFPPIPPEANRANWAFTLPIGPF